MRYIRVFILAMIGIFIVIFAQFRAFGQDCYQWYSIDNEQFTGCSNLFKWEQKVVSFYPYAGFDIQHWVGTYGGGECCGSIVYKECWPQFNEPYGYSTGGPLLWYWRGRWSQTVYDQVCASVIGVGQCNNSDFEMFDVEQDCFY